MNLQINNRKEFISAFLAPLSKLNESLVVKIGDSRISSVNSSSDGTLILYATYDQPNKPDDLTSLNIPDVNRLLKVLDCIPEEEISLVVESNNINYKSDAVGFKYHLLEDGIISAPSVSIDKIKKLQFDLSFELEQSSIMSLLKGSTFTSETDKLYFFTKEGSMYGRLTDLDRHNVDVYTQKIADTFDGTPILTPIPINFETVRVICGLRFDKLKVYVNTDMKVFVFNLQQDNTELKFISSAYVS